MRSWQRFMIPVVGFTCLLVDGQRCVAQRPAGPPQPDFQRFFEQLFGTNDPQRQQQLARVPVSWAEERQFGGEAVEAFLAQLRRQGIEVTRRGRDVDYVRKLLDKIRPRMRRADRYRRLTVLIADSPATDARCFPGGTVLLFRGLLDFAENEAALVGVLGHELSHLDHGHQLRHIRALKLAQSTFQAAGRGNDPTRMMQSGMFLAGQFARPFRAEDETVADEDGARWAYQAGYDPREMAKLFRRLHERDDGRGDWIPRFFRSHPYRLERFQAVMQLYAELQARDPRPELIVGRENLQRRRVANE